MRHVIAVVAAAFAHLPAPTTACSGGQNIDNGPPLLVVEAAGKHHVRVVLATHAGRATTLTLVGAHGARIVRARPDRHGRIVVRVDDSARYAVALVANVENARFHPGYEALSPDTKAFLGGTAIPAEAVHGVVATGARTILVLRHGPSFVGMAI
jgi:hypothetical protein